MFNVASLRPGPLFPVFRILGTVAGIQILQVRLGLDVIHAPALAKVQQGFLLLGRFFGFDVWLLNPFELLFAKGRQCFLLLAWEEALAFLQSGVFQIVGEVILVLCSSALGVLSAKVFENFHYSFSLKFSVKMKHS